jgi:tetratricopeptide (TPR) repeat protein
MLNRYARFCGLLGIIVLVVNFSGCMPAPQTSRRFPTPSQPPVAVEDPTLSAEWAYQQGLQLFERGEHKQAIQYFHLALERDPHHIQSYLRLGDVYTQQENYVVAESYYNKVLEYDPQSLPALRALGALYWRMEKHRDALTMYRKVLEIDENDQVALQQIDAITQEIFEQHYTQGIAYQQAGDIYQATVEFQKALSFDPENVEFAVEIGNLFLQQQDYMMADGYFQQALDANPDFVPALLGAGRVQLATKNYEGALQYFNRALQQQPGSLEITELIRQAQRDRVETSLPRQYWDIVMAEQVSRGEIAALIMVDLMLEARLGRPSQVAIISDITTHWAKPYIIDVVQYGIMSLPPDRFFRPAEAITKGELAFVIDTLFQKLGMPLADGGRLVFSDVHPDNAYYNAISRVYSAGFMMASSATSFGVVETLTGEEALQIFEQIRPLIR